MEYSSFKMVDGDLMVGGTIKHKNRSNRRSQMVSIDS